MNKLKGIVIRKITEVSFEVNEKKIRENNSEVNINFTIDHELIDGEVKQMAYTIKVTFTEKGFPDKIFASGATKTVFDLIFDNNQINETEQTNIDKQSLITMLSLSISHTRALLAKNLKGTNHENLLVPIVNPTLLFEQTMEKNLQNVKVS